jgi:hypothetical protein
MRTILMTISVVFNIPFLIFFSFACAYIFYKDFKNDDSLTQLNIGNIKEYVKPIYYNCQPYAKHINWITWILITYLTLL